MDIAAAIDNLDAARRALLGVIEDLDDRTLRTQFHPEFSPIGWHLGHVAFQEEWFLLRRFGGRPALAPELDGLFDSFRSRKAGRAAQLPERDFLLEHAARVRREVERLLGARGDDEAMRLARFIANHERQHTEIVVSVRLLGELYMPWLAGADVGEPPSAALLGEWVDIDGGTFPLGVDTDPDAADNELRAHAVSLDDYALARFPVTEDAWLEMMRAGGYAERRLWSDAGWAFLIHAHVDAPAHFRHEPDGSYTCRTLCGPRPAGGAYPIAHVSFHEAEAFARFAGARLPSEAEWEYAASWDAGRGQKRRYPWGDELPAGRADLELAGASPAPCGLHPEGRSAMGVEDLCGGVWEWTSSAFASYPGFSPGTYAGYSAPWFDGSYRVARGGSFATAKENARATFRNWYACHLRVPCLGVRLARGR